MVELTPCRITGNAGEDAATNYLRAAGYAILARNWRNGRLELDIVCQDKDTLVFIEVKTRSAGGMTLPGEAVNYRKRHALFRAAQMWLRSHAAWDTPCRFDVLCVTHCADAFHVEHITDAFDISSFVDGSHASWQPW